MNIKIPATSANLGPGFDSLGLALSLYNEAIITPSKLTCINIKGEESHRIRLKKNNIFVSIFYETLESLIGQKPNMKFEFINNIPFSRGLGSSSAVIIGAIASAYKIANLKISKEVILNKALSYENHPDNITPAVYGGFCSSIVHNSKIYTKKKNLPKDIKAVVVIPDSPMSTVKSRSKLPKKYSMNECVGNISHSSYLSACFFDEDWDSLRLASKDFLHEDRRMKEFEILYKVRELAFEYKSLMSTLSGSGSSFFNMVYKKDVKNLKKALKKEFPAFKILELDFDNKGFFIQDEIKS